MTTLKTKIFEKYRKLDKTKKGITDRFSSSKKLDNSNKYKLESNEIEVVVFGHTKFNFFAVLEEFRLFLEETVEECFFAEFESKFTDGASNFNPEVFKCQTLFVHPVKESLSRFSHSSLQLYGKPLKDDNKDLFVRSVMSRTLKKDNEELIKTEMQQLLSKSTCVNLGLKSLGKPDSVKIGTQFYTREGVVISFFKYMDIKTYDKMKKKSSDVSDIVNNCYRNTEDLPSIVSIHINCVGLNKLKEAQDSLAKYQKKLSSYLIPCSRSALGFD